MKDLKPTLFLFVNLGFSVYAGAVLATAMRLSYDPSTYIWFRLMCEQQYRVTTAYLYFVAFHVFLLVYVGTTSVIPVAIKYITYFAATALLICSEAVYGLWMCISMKNWWESSQQAELLRQLFQMKEDAQMFLESLALIFPLPLIEEINTTIYEVERDVPKNVYAVVTALVVAVGLQVTALVVSWLLRRGTVTLPTQKKQSGPGALKSRIEMFNKV